MPARKPAADATLAALYRAVLENPDDDLPRLVYADRLDELGDHPRAEFIRTQIHVANTKPWDEGHADAQVKSEVLFERHKEAWGIKDLIEELVQPKRVTPGMFNPFVRGFVETTRVNLETFSARHKVNPFVRGFPEITWANIDTFSVVHSKSLKKYPIRELVLFGGERRRRAIEIINEVRPRKVEFLSSGPLVYSELSDGPPLPSVRCIKLQHIPIVDEVRDIAGRGRFAFPNVEELHVGWMSDESRLSRLLTFIRELRWPKLRALTLHGEFTPRVQAALADAGWVGQLDTLALHHSPSRELADQPAGQLTPLFRSDRTTALRSLSLESFAWSPETERAFAESHLGPLDHFEITGHCEPSASNLPALLSSPVLAGVKSLHLPTSGRGAVEEAQLIGRNGQLRQLHWGGRYFPAEAFAALAASPASQSLRRLNLQWVLLTADAVQALLASPWPNLAELTFQFGRHDGREVARLIDHPHLARLTHLEIGGGGYSDHLWKALAKSNTVGRFHKLKLKFAIGDAELNAILDNPEVCKVGQLVLPVRVKFDRKTLRRYENVFGVRVTRDW